MVKKVWKIKSNNIIKSKAPNSRVFQSCVFITRHPLPFLPNAKQPDAINELLVCPSPLISPRPPKHWPSKKQVVGKDGFGKNVFQL